MSAVVMVQCGAADGRPLPGDGQYLASFEFEAFGGQGEIALTPNLANAKRFPSAAEAFVFYRTSPQCRPTRPDGRPNRPLTAANWELRPVD